MTLLIEILLTSHAHFDHAGGLAELKRLTGARLIAGKPEAEMLACGGRGDCETLLRKEKQL